MRVYWVHNAEYSNFLVNALQYRCNQRLREKEGMPSMSTKRKPPTLQQKKEEVNRKALMWIGVSLTLLILLIIVLFIVAGN